MKNTFLHGHVIAIIAAGLLFITLFAPYAAGYEVVGWGLDVSTTPDGNDFIAIAAGQGQDMVVSQEFGLALKSDGSIVGWGDNDYGQATPPAGNNFIAIAAGNLHSLALKSDGSIVGWGYNAYGGATPPTGNNFIAIAAGTLHSLALKSDGSIVGWGFNNYGQATPPAGNNFIAIAAGLYHGLALKSDGSIVGWGDNTHGQATPPAGNDFIAIAAGWYQSLAIKSDGSIVGWGEYLAYTSSPWRQPYYVQVTAPAGNNFVAVAAGVDFSLALKGVSPLTATLTITPSTRTDYGSLLVGNIKDKTFNASNVGTSTISGTASVASPFSVVGGGSYTLAPGQSITTTIRYAPTSAGNNIAYVTFTGGGDQTRQVTGSAYTDPTPTTGTITGQVTRATDNSPMNGVTISVVGPGVDLSNGAQNPQTITGVSGSQSGVFSVSGLRPNAHYSVTANPPTPLLLNMVTTNEVTVVAGQTTTVNIALSSIAPPPELSAVDTPVVLVRGAAIVSPVVLPDNSWLDLETQMSLLSPSFSQVWNCNEDSIIIDGDQGIAPNAAQLKAYIQTKVLQYAQENGGQYPPAINIVAHSMGGLIVRQALGNNDHFVFDLVDRNGQPQCVSIKVGKVIMLGTPNAGSPLADIPLASLWPWGSDAIRDLTTTNISGHPGAKDGFNFNHPWPSGVSLYLYAATDGFYSQYLSLKCSAFLLSTSDPSPGSPWNVNDGEVPRPSVSGTDYYVDVVRQALLAGGTAPLTPIKTFSASPVEDCTDYQITGKGIDHVSLVHDSATLGWVIATLTGTATSATSQSVKTRPAMESTAMDAPSTNLLGMQPIEQISSILSSGQVNATSVISDAATTLSFQLLAQATDVVFRLQDPAGTVIDSTTPSSNSNVQYSAIIADSNLMLITYTISNPATGTWQVVLDGNSMSETQASCLLRVFGDSTVFLLPQTILPCNQGQDVVASCGLADLNSNPAMPVVNASITAMIQLPDGSTNNLTLFDDGWHNDGAPNDGVYASVLTNVQQAGTYSIAYRATGTNGQGQALQRVATGGFSVSSGHGSLWGDPVYENLDTDGDGIADFLEVKCWVNPTADGNYILAGDLVDANGTHRFSQSAGFAADGSGPIMATLIFDLAEMRAAGGKSIYHIENLQLFEVTSTGTAWLDAYHGSSVVNIQGADLDMDGDVDFVDYAIFANHWMYQNCAEPDWCEGTDFNHSGSVDILDLATFARYWLEGL